jgi:hypothetical protein
LTLSFDQQLILGIVEYVIPPVMMFGFFVVMLRKLPSIMERLYRFTKSKSDYQCRCARCQAERIRKMGRIGRWRQAVKSRNRFEREGV